MAKRDRGSESRHSPFAIRIATVAGIPIRVHFTFWLFLLWVLVVGKSNGPLVALLIVAIFACIAMHELGHALVARRYGIQTRDIMLSPIGGVATIGSRRPTAKAEIAIALAGPLVNVLIAFAIGCGLFLKEGRMPIPSVDFEHQSFMHALYSANAFLPMFNMIPAFPMDGGRVLRAFLAVRMDENRATRIAAGVGQVFALAFAVIGIVAGDLLFLLVAFFVFVAAGQEVSATAGYSAVSNHAVWEAMETDFRSVSSGATMEEVARLLLEGSQREFPVLVGESPVGTLRKDDILRAIGVDGARAYVAAFMDRDLLTVGPRDPLTKVLQLFTSGATGPILVMEAEKLVGMVTRENLGEFMMLSQARFSGRRPAG